MAIPKLFLLLVPFALNCLGCGPVAEESLPTDAHNASEQSYNDDWVLDFSMGEFLPIGYGFRFMATTTTATGDAIKCPGTIMLGDEVKWPELVPHKQLRGTFRKTGEDAPYSVTPVTGFVHPDDHSVWELVDLEPAK